jgi:hypothetical protein
MHKKLSAETGEIPQKFRRNWWQGQSCIKTMGNFPQRCVTACTRTRTRSQELVTKKKVCVQKKEMWTEKVDKRTEKTEQEKKGGFWSQT